MDRLAAVHGTTFPQYHMKSLKTSPDTPLAFEDSLRTPPRVASSNSLSAYGSSRSLHELEAQSSGPVLEHESSLLQLWDVFWCDLLDNCSYAVHRLAVHDMLEADMLLITRRFGSESPSSSTTSSSPAPLRERAVRNGGLWRPSVPTLLPWPRLPSTHFSSYNASSDAVTDDSVAAPPAIVGGPLQGVPTPEPQSLQLHSRPLAPGGASASDSSQLQPWQQQVHTDAAVQQQGSQQQDVALLLQSFTQPLDVATAARAASHSDASTSGRQQQYNTSQTQSQQQYMLGTWAGRQYTIMPDGARQNSTGSGAAAGAGGSSSPTAPGSGANGSGSGSGSGGSKGSGAVSSPTPIASSMRPWQQQQRGGQPPDTGGVHMRQQQQQRGAVQQDSEDDEAVVQAAWRWRFARRWQAEQARPPDAPRANGAAGSVSDGMEEALQYLAACGETQWHLARTMSTDVLGSHGDGRGGQGTLGMSDSILGGELMLMLEDGSSYSFSGARRGGRSGMLGGTLSREASMNGLIGGGLAGAAAGGGGGGRRSGEHERQQPAVPAGAARGGHTAAGQQHTSHPAAAHNGYHHTSSAVLARDSATHEVRGMTRRAQQLLAAQGDLDRAAMARWREAQAQGGQLWVGALLEAVEVDDWGKFKFLLLRLRDRLGRQKLLVRGANYASEARLQEGLHRQLMAACAGHGVPPEAVEAIGGGVMEWRRDRDRHLHVGCGYVLPHSSPSGPMTASEVMNLAAVLTKQYLPMHYKISIDGGKVL